MILLQFSVVAIPDEIYDHKFVLSIYRLLTSLDFLAPYANWVDIVRNEPAIYNESV